MFQFEVAGATYENNLRVNVYDKMDLDGWETAQKPIFAITSQQTGKQKLFYPNVMQTGDHKERFYRFRVYYIKTEVDGLFYPDNGYIALNNKDFPFGFYDLKIYQKKLGFTTLDLDNLQGVVYTGLMNVKPLDSGTPNNYNIEVLYTEYDNNDSDTDNVYLTADIP